MAVTMSSPSQLNPFGEGNQMGVSAPDVTVYDDEKGGSSYAVCGSEYRELLRIAREHVTVMKRLFQIKRTSNNPDWGAIYWDCRQGLSLEDAKAISSLTFKDGLTFFKVLDTGHRSEEIQHATIQVLHDSVEVYNTASHLQYTFAIKSMVEMYHDPQRRVLVVIFPGYSFEIVCYEQATLRALYFGILMRHEDDTPIGRPDPVASTERVITEGTPRQWGGSGPRVSSHQTVDINTRAANVALPKSQGTIWTAAVSHQTAQGSQPLPSRPIPSQVNPQQPTSAGFQQEVPRERSHFVSQQPPSQWSQQQNQQSQQQQQQQQQQQPFTSQPYPQGVSSQQITASGVYGAASPIQSKVNLTSTYQQPVDSHIPTIQLAPPSGSAGNAQSASTTSWGGTPPVTPMVVQTGQSQSQPNQSQGQQHLQTAMSSPPKNLMSIVSNNNDSSPPNPSMASLNTVAQHLSVTEQQSQLARLQQQINETPDL